MKRKWRRRMVGNQRRKERDSQTRAISAFHGRRKKKGNMIMQEQIARNIRQMLDNKVTRFFQSDKCIVFDSELKPVYKANAHQLRQTRLLPGISTFAYSRVSKLPVRRCKENGTRGMGHTEASCRSLLHTMHDHQHKHTEEARSFTHSVFPLQNSAWPLL